MIENKMLELLKRNLWYVVGTLSLIILSFTTSLFFSKSSKHSVKDYFSAKILFEKMGGKAPLSQDDLDTATALIKKHPELSPHYEGMLALALTHNENMGEATSISKNHLKRIEKLCPSYHQEFLNTTLLIHEGKYQLALEKSLLLEETLANSSFPRLRDLNRLRIAFLVHHSHDTTTSNIAFEKFKKSPSSYFLETLFSEKGYTLDSYFLENLKKD